MEIMTSSERLVHLGPGLHNPACDRFEIPNDLGVNITAVRWPSNGHECHDDSAKVYPLDGGGWERVSGPGQTERLPDDFEPIYIWTITLDDRFGFDFDSRAEVENAIPLLLNGMAIAAGWPSHAAISRRAEPVVALRRAAALIGPRQDCAEVVDALLSQSDRLSMEELLSTE